MQISATVQNAGARHEARVCTDADSRALDIPAQPAGRGSAVNGGEFLMLALATCYCNDLYREAERLGIALDGVEVEASARFPGIGLAATDIRYRARIASPAPREAIDELLRRTDAVAEVHNTLRAGVPVVRSDARDDAQARGAASSPVAARATAERAAIDTPEPSVPSDGSASAAAASASAQPGAAAAGRIA
jgi:organic hydroperoxide reductase OsmC/OhrA